MLELSGYNYEVKALVDGWEITDIIESESELTAYELAARARQHFEGDNVRLIGFRVKRY